MLSIHLELPYVAIGLSDVKSISSTWYTFCKERVFSTTLIRWLSTPQQKVTLSSIPSVADCPPDIVCLRKPKYGYAHGVRGRSPAMLRHKFGLRHFLPVTGLRAVRLKSTNSTVSGHRNGHLRHTRSKQRISTTSSDATNAQAQKAQGRKIENDYSAVQPPSTEIFAPVMFDAASEHRNDAIAAT